MIFTFDIYDKIGYPQLSRFRNKLFKYLYIEKNTILFFLQVYLYDYFIICVPCIVKLMAVLSKKRWFRARRRPVAVLRRPVLCQDH